MNGLIGAVGSTRVRYVAEGEFLFAAAEVLDFQLLAGDFAFLLVAFPFAAKGSFAAPSVPLSQQTIASEESTRFNIGASVPRIMEETH